VNPRAKVSLGDEETPDRRIVYSVVFLAGFVGLGIELAGSRLLDPWFGNSILVWAALIGLILLYLAVGYGLGGRLADRHPRPSLFLTLAALAGLATGLIPLGARPILSRTADVFIAYDLALLVGALAATLVLFAPAVILLGCVAPFAIRILVGGRDDAGRTAGRVFALSTAGSLLGVFVPVLVLLPNLGTRRTFLLMGLSLAGLATAALARRRRRRALFLALAWMALAVLALLPPPPLHGAAETVFEQESAYNYLRVQRHGEELLLRLNEGAGIHSVYRPGGGLADGIWDYFLLAPFFAPAPRHPEDVNSLLILGLAAGTVARLYTEAYGPIPIRGVELDPAIIAVGQRFFAMNQPNLTAVAGDARYVLRRDPGRYDVIAVDAYRPPYIPFHLTTVEFFAEVRRHLTPDGVVAVNVARTATDDSLVVALAGTMAAVFPAVFILDEPMAGFDLGNSLVVATKRPATLADFLANTADLPEPLLAEVARRARPYARPAPRTGPVLTDDRAAVEQIVHGIVLRFLLTRLP
jgi:predicted membrane-bound spermidine synthase